LLSSRALGIKERVQCVLIHEYGHLAGAKHTRRRSSIMYYQLNPQTCHRWLVRYHVG
jgi:predicted Zn-dependent protease